MSKDKRTIGDNSANINPMQQKVSESVEKIKKQFKFEPVSVEEKYVSKYHHAYQREKLERTPEERQMEIDGNRRRNLCDTENEPNMYITSAEELLRNGYDPAVHIALRDGEVVIRSDLTCKELDQNCREDDLLSHDDWKEQVYWDDYNE